MHAHITCRSLSRARAHAGMMTFDPALRWTADEVLRSPYFDRVRNLTDAPPWPWVAESASARVREH
jgi:hypothetical protein